MLIQKGLTIHNLKDFREILEELRNLCCCSYTVEKRCMFCKWANLIRETNDYALLMKEEDKFCKILREKEIEEDRAHNVFCVDCRCPVTWKHQENRCGDCWKLI
jgi:hypothetical protein